MGALVMYVGSKPTKTDNVAGTGIVWNGHGDVQEVPGKAVSALLAHGGVWQLVESVEQPVEQPAEQPAEHDMAPLVELDAMSKNELRDYAQRHFNHAFAPNTGEEKMRHTIVGLMNRG